MAEKNLTVKPTKPEKRQINASVDLDIYNRVQALAEEDRRNAANIAELCIIGYLPFLEEELKLKKALRSKHALPRPLPKG